MYQNDCRVCKEKVSDNCKSIACEACRDWFHLPCVGLRGASDKVLGATFLSGLCRECLEASQAWWKHRRQEISSRDGEPADRKAEDSSPSGEKPVEKDSLIGDSEPRQQDHPYCRAGSSSEVDSDSEGE